MVAFDRPSPASPARPMDKPEPMAALADVVKAAQRMVVARIDLLQVEAKETAQGIAMMAGAALVAVFGWVLLMCGAVTLLDNVIPMPAAFAIVGGVHILAALGVALSARGKARPGQSTLTPHNDDERGHK